MKDFLSAILPRQGIYFAVTKNLKGFVHFPCKTIDELAVKIGEIEAKGLDVYFACASYAKDSYTDSEGKTRQRTADNAQFARSFWLDIDCGAEKAQKGQGYLGPQEAADAVTTFCGATKLPIPLTVFSGGGLHCYWSMTEDVAKDDWLTVARMLKKLTSSGPVPLLADPARTSDVASILRPVGTTNRKPERNGAQVELIGRMEPMAFDTFRTAVELAHHQIARGHQQPIPAYIANRTAQVTLGSQSPTLITLDELKKPLSFLDADMPRGEWWPILAAIADAHGEGGRALAREWSSGALGTAPAARFHPVKFEQDYTGALNRIGGTGQRTSIGTIIHKARAAGWAGSASAVGSEWFEQMNDDFAFIDSEALIYRLPYRKFIKPTDLRILYANKKVPVGSGNGSRWVDQGTLWLTHPARRMHSKLVMRPGEPQVTTDNNLNTWTGFAVSPLPGTVTPFVDLLRRLVPESQARLYILLWLAHLVQHPGVKMYTALVMWSHKQGVGKNLLFECVTSIIGRQHATVISQAQIASEFNGWASDKILAIGDEVSSEDRRQHADKLKGFITGNTIQLNEKYQPAREVENLLNFIFLSNSPSALFVGDHDRRYHIVEVTADRVPAAEAAAFVKWRDNGGLAHLLYQLQKAPLDGFNPRASAPVTDAKRQMIEDNRSDLEAWAESIMQAGPAISFGRDLATAAELAQRYASDTGNKAPSTKAAWAVGKKCGYSPWRNRLIGRKNLKLHGRPKCPSNSLCHLPHKCLTYRDPPRVCLGSCLTLNY